MFPSLLLIIRILAAWFGAVLIAGLVWNGLFERTIVAGGASWLFNLAMTLVMASVLIGTISHLRRIWLITGRLDSAALSSRQRRQIEVPLDTAAAFALIEGALRELPRAEEAESAPDSLQVRVKVRRVDSFDGPSQPSRFNIMARFAVKRDLVQATVTPGNGTSSITLMVGPDASAWLDLFVLDDGVNVENAEAVTRAITRRVADQRRQEQADVVQTVNEKELTVARLNLLNAQVEPHFLYNTLASAQVLTRTDPPRADVMLGHLIQYLRSSLPRTDDALSTLGEELDRTLAYLEILKIRMGSRLSLQIEVPDTLKSVPMPSMMLQTLVENAIKHGLEPKTGGGTIWILARRHDDHATLTVADDGQGFGGQSSGTGIGLKNLRERLRLTFGGDASFAIVSNFPSGVAATLTLPLTVQGVRP
ncbi:histidine kinase [Pseudoxanthomonas sp.]|uniref:sensor histidine kinase n=1 Tax=Pseudoxanthomonas sp. TaxID=1871049 RepID=UPI002FE0BF89